jgi:hypothetical protein
MGGLMGLEKTISDSESIGIIKIKYIYLYE